jgi:4-alpha-glucanotransferase
MTTHLKIHYNTRPGEHICICGTGKLLGNWDATKAVKLDYVRDGIWETSLKLPAGTKELEYNYLLVDDGGNFSWEWGSPRKLSLVDLKSPYLFAFEHWRSPDNREKVLYSSAFSQVIMKPDASLKGSVSKAKKVIQFTISVPRIGEGQQICILGNQKALGNWDKTAPLLLSCGDQFPLWKGSMPATGIKLPMEYKYGVYDVNQKEVVQIEAGPNRQIIELPEENEFTCLRSDESFNYPDIGWRGAGVAVPVFSLRSEKSFGIGEFSDLIDFIDWARSVGMKMVQILPVNETIATHSWLDSYPYKSISVIALHPVYLNIHKMGALKDKKLMAEFAARQKELNELPFVDYPEVHRVKSRYYKLIFDQEKSDFFDRADYQEFFEKNREWLVPYAAFAYLRDKNKTADFRLWKKFGKYNRKEIEKLCSPGAPEWDDISVHYFLQYHLDKQLREAAEYARSNGVVLKGDIPIGISPNSVEAWTDPQLFNLDAQAGAPPDSFSIKGQNWGFPTYNWERMATDNYAWWKMRLQKMAEYFDAYRIDHILGFFRIWEIPTDAVEGLLGAFNPALPLTAAEIEYNGIHFDYERLVKPYIRHHIVENLFGDHASDVFSKFLDGTGNGAYKMKKDFDTQQKVNQFFLKNKEEEALNDVERKIRDGLFALIANVLFVQTGYDQYHPRITLQFTSSFAELDDYTKDRINALYNHFFYKRHDEFWYHKGMEKLPGIISASNMLICGEDLGMVPDCVHPVMDQLAILRLVIQRMPSNPKIKFAHPADAPYLSVCTTSTHDMATIRGWWEEDRETTQEFFNRELGNPGEAPFFAEPWICQQMITQHIHSPAMWTVFPVQDLIAMDEKLRWKETHQERINDPSNVRHHWKYRMHEGIETLKKAGKLNELIKSLVRESGRDD